MNSLESDEKLQVSIIDDFISGHSEALSIKVNIKWRNKAPQECELKMYDRLEAHLKA